MFARVCAFLVLVIGIAMGGPSWSSPSGENAPVGSLPDPDCNGVAKEEAACPLMGGVDACILEKWEVPRTELKGTPLTKRYNNDALRCYAVANHDCARHSLRLTYPCTKVFAP